MKLLIDENIPPEVSRKLSQEHETKTVREIEKGITDKEVTEIASEENRCIVTQDTDFSEIYYFSRPKELKITVVKPQKQTVKKTQPNTTETQEKSLLHRFNSHTRRRRRPDETKSRRTNVATPRL